MHPSAALRNGGTALAQARADFVVAKRALAARGAADEAVGDTRSADETHALAEVGALLRAGDVVVLGGRSRRGQDGVRQGLAVALGITSRS